MNVLALSWTPSISSLYFFMFIGFFNFFNKEFVVEEAGFLKKQTKNKNNQGKVVQSLSLCSLCEKNASFFK